MSEAQFRDQIQSKLCPSYFEVNWDTKTIRKGDCVNKLGKKKGNETYVGFRYTEQKMSDIYSSLWEFHMTYRGGEKMWLT